MTIGRIIKELTRLLGYDLVRVGHHRNEHVQEYNEVAHAVAAKHEQCPEPRELLNPRELELRERDEPEGSPEERLRCLKEIGEAAPNKAGVAVVLRVGQPSRQTVALVVLQVRVVPQKLQMLGKIQCYYYSTSHQSIFT